MNWETIMTSILRNLIGDNGATQEYSDCRLKDIICDAGQLTLHEVDYVNDYTIDAFSDEISPDPVVTNDDAFVNLVTLKAACMIAGAEYRLASKRGGVMKDGPAAMDGRGPMEGAKGFKEDMCSAYQKAVRDYKLGSATAGEAIVGPYRTNIYSHHPYDQHRR